MKERFARTTMLLGEEAMKHLAEARVAVFGVGGVGGYAAEALVRSGIGAIDLIDNDIVAESNINRQIIAAESTVGRYKTDVMKERMLDINPDIAVRTYPCFFLPEHADEFDFAAYTYIADAVDTVTAKITLAVIAEQMRIPIISSMGAGNKLDPTAFEVTDIYHTSVCPLARIMRRELKKRGVSKLKVIYSREEPVKPCIEEPVPDGSSRRAIPGSVAFVPSVAGLIMAGEIIKDIAGEIIKDIAGGGA